MKVLRKIFLLLIISCSFPAFSRAPGSWTQLKNDLQNVTLRNLVSFVNDFVKASSPSRMVGLEGHDKGRDWIVETIGKIDSKKSGKLTVSKTVPETDLIKAFYQKDFDEKVEGKIPANHPDYKKWQTFTTFMKGMAEKRKETPVQNIVWEKSGLAADKVLVVTAHYDTVSHNKDSLLINENESMPGANYNATGVAAALGLIQTLSKIDLNYSVKIVFLDYQGLGFHGSELYARELKAEGKSVMGVVNLEMLGQDTSYFDKNKKTGNMCVYVRNNPDEVKWIQGLLKHGSQMTGKVQFEVKPNSFESSDNINFWKQNFLAATFSQNWEDDFNPKFYQTPQDTPETLNHETLWHSYLYIGGVVIGTLLDLTQ